MELEAFVSQITLEKVTLISNPLLLCWLTLVSETLVLVLRYIAYPTALWVNPGWRKASDGDTIKILIFSNILKLMVGVKKGFQSLKFLPNYKTSHSLVNLVV